MSVTERVETLLAAKADALVKQSARDLEALIHPDFTYVNAGGVRFDRAGYVDFCCTSGRIVFSEQRFSELDVKSFPGFAIATMILSDRFSSRGQPVAATYRSLCVFSLSEEHCLWVAGQTMAVGAG